MSMHTRKQLEKKLPALKEWLSARGAEVLAPTNEYEVVRLRAGEKTIIVYAKASGDLTIDRPARDMLNAFVSGGPWSAGVSVKRAKRSAEVQRLIERDGGDCFLCRRPLGDDITIEHLVPVAAGGPNHIANKALAHKACNLQMGHLSLMEKLAMREANLAGDTEAKP